MFEPQLISSAVKAKTFNPIIIPAVVSAVVLLILAAAALYIFKKPSQPKDDPEKNFTHLRFSTDTASMIRDVPDAFTPPSMSPSNHEIERGLVSA